MQDSPTLPGLTFRPFRGEPDYPAMIAVLQVCKDADQIEEIDRLETLAASYSHLVNCDPYQDMLFIEAGGQLIGYTRAFWQEAYGLGRVYMHEGFLLPEWRGMGIGRFMLSHNERRLREIANGHPHDQPRFFRVEAMSTEVAKARLLERAGYSPARYFCEMLRTLLDEIPACHMPTGLELRPALPGHYRAIWEANNRAFRDHWAHIDYTEEDYQFWLQGDEEFQPQLWQVAWDSQSDQVAGMVMGYILEDQNVKFNRQRGWIGDVCVLRPWRGRGLASALMSGSLRALRERGMHEAALSADTENLTGALRLYQNMGFGIVKYKTVFQKPMD